MAEKLVRDKLVERIPENELRIATSDEYPAFLANKLREEVEELINSQGDPMEFADVQEVLAAMQMLFGLDDTDVLRARSAKWFERGAFDGRLIWTNAPE